MFGPSILSPWNGDKYTLPAIFHLIDQTVPWVMINIIIESSSLVVEELTKRGLIVLISLIGLLNNGMRSCLKPMNQFLGKEHIIPHSCFIHILSFLEVKASLILMTYGFLISYLWAGGKSTLIPTVQNLALEDFIPQPR